jgi:GT2 family glycosyltransferase
LITKDESQRQELVKSAVKLANKLPNKTVEQCKQFAEIKFLKRDGNLFYANGANAWIH